MSLNLYTIYYKGFRLKCITQTKPLKRTIVEIYKSETYESYVTYKKSVLSAIKYIDKYYNNKGELNVCQLVQSTTMAILNS